jgi:hypothetical protein
MLYEIYVDDELVGVKDTLDNASDFLTDYVYDKGLDPKGEYTIVEDEGVIQ